MHLRTRKDLADDQAKSSAFTHVNGLMVNGYSLVVAASLLPSLWVAGHWFSFEEPNLHPHL